MSAANQVAGPLRVLGDIFRSGKLTPDVPRSNLELESTAEYVVNITTLRQHDAVQTVLSNTPAADDLGIAGGTFGVQAIYVTAGDLKAAGATTRRARFTVALPPEYQAGQTVKLRLSAGMLTTIADTSCSCDLEAFINGGDSTIDGSDLVTTVATSMNSLTFSDKDFTVDGASLFPGDELDVRLSVICTDAASITAVTPVIGRISLLCDIRG